jgi:putative membrane protein
MSMSDTSKIPSENRVYIIVQLVSLVIAAALFYIIYSENGVQVGEGHWSKSLSGINALLNTLTACLLVFGFIQIKKGNKENHIKFMLSATMMSALFLISYVTYHFYQGDTKFIAVGWIRPTYFFILITHILLSIVNLPMILLTLWFAFTSKHEKHKKFARITFPIWLYVSVTGVLVYLFLKFFNN